MATREAPVLPRHLIEEIRQTMPSTHEIGGHLLCDAHRHIRDVRVFKGKPCRDEQGVRFRNAQCKIKKPDAEISFHTHPKSNRPSSSDLRNCVFKHPDINGRGKRRTSVLFTPQGVWWYRPSPELVRAWRSRKPRSSGVRHVMKRWSQYGRRYVERAARTRAYIRAMAAEGLRLRYVPYSELTSELSLG
jgi:hypothetical protein